MSKKSVGKQRFLEEQKKLKTLKSRLTLVVVDLYYKNSDKVNLLKVEQILNCLPFNTDKEINIYCSQEEFNSFFFYCIFYISENGISSKTKKVLAEEWKRTNKKQPQQPQQKQPNIYE